jgi:tRNA nucleotidyltransferase/poly(A) polymerase
MSTSSAIHLVVERLRELLHEAPGEAYFVGGCVRDLLLGRPLHDLDLVVAGDAIALARTVARAFRAAFVLLDEENGIARVVLRGEEDGGGSTIDFARMRGAHLVEDLAARDLTINAMAMFPAAFWQFVHGETATPELIAPHGGQEDLAAGRLRAVSRQSFTDDPLRTMRVVRFAGELHFAVAPETAAWVRETAALLPQVSWERIRDELVRLLNCPQSAPYLPLLNSLGLLPHVLPELAVGPLERQDRAWETVCCLEWLAAAMEGGSLRTGEGSYWRPAVLTGYPTLDPGLLYTAHLRRYLDERLAERPRRVLLKLAVLLEPGLLETGKSEAATRTAQEAARRLRLSTRESVTLGTLATFRTWAGTLEASRRCVYRFYRDTGEGAIGVLLLTLAADLAQAGPSLEPGWWDGRVDRVEAILRLRYEQTYEVIDPPRLLDGSDLIQTLGLVPGPLIGSLLEGIREAQTAGEIVSREDALAWARRALEKSPGA